MATQFITRFDMRAPGASNAERQELFSRAVEQATYVDAHGQDAIMLSEHHGSPDGYLPSPLLLASAIAARTQRIPISVSALIVNLYQPRRLAEDIAVLDLISAGRVSYVLALGYRPVEYAMFDRDWESRGLDIENAIGEMLDAWAGTDFTAAGETTRVTPPPFSRPHPFLYYGGSSPAAARRAARLGLNFAPQLADRALKQLYLEECERLGRQPGHVLIPPTGPATVFCSTDPDRFWANHGEHLLADARGYDAWHGDMESHVRDRSTTVRQLRAAGSYLVATPDELIERCRSGELRLITSHPLCGNMPAEPSWENQQLLCEKVIPALREG
ncbi:LLM class flavin-dependent oxidoreductase [Aldersonia sp. NBC_00410]|uniref:LLM class flavin-dependent oxidoreductase n=1 Tax=Aldersonia sp. NBC_00410 TaxID=2975954 RepID=UPI002258C999|nr:LLM class flavin-dependent oxidoreductase [Aldersonia sp. NBC_00410]MCX5044338.1 LLM class flavin-dependent oxidoreductase [Aldersonia sp. NBC_00410]